MREWSGVAEWGGVAEWAVGWGDVGRSTITQYCTPMADASVVAAGLPSLPTRPPLRTVR